MSKKQQSKSLENQIRQEINYVEFLKKRLQSENFKAGVSEQEYKETKKKYDKAKFKLKMLCDQSEISGK